ncbi:ABC transporter substrate-binding protein [Limoniibacter endophyticus]|uniref:Sugar ABC transporter substrate-binding protein n=1 Tax=Limoniibacter endophyticus TaxID=1565040 RepID=A0A8J3DL00_9HYPH|nr:ABC transporter substrate-binding protein [Limoniibacter endophyticus]GHC78089.1 sugar ABC transporter substrate-binding protein [Limoniibacter endophyticus]
MLKNGMFVRGVCAAAMMTGFAMSSASAQTLDYWVYSDFAQGDAGEMQREFITEFTKKHPDATINISGRGDDDLTAGQVAGAASGNTPDVFMNSLWVGAQLVDVGALDNVYDKWMAMPEEFRAQFDPEAIKKCMPEPDKLYCLPYTGYGSLMFRNLNVLEKAGIDTSKPPATWAEWLEQMKKVKEAGAYAIPDQTLIFNSVAEMYGVAGDNSVWGIDWANRKTKIDVPTMTKVLEMFVELKPLTSGTSRNDQATRDLFISDQLAFHTIGPWVNPTYEQAAKNGKLKYDFVLVPGISEGKHGGIQNYEFIGVAPGPNRDIAWEFAAYVAEQNQMKRWALLLSRFNSNSAAMTDPEVNALPLIAKSVEAVKNTLDVQPPYFVGSVPNCYLSTVVDYAAATADGEYTPAEGAEEMISELNECLAE